MGVKLKPLEPSSRAWNKSASVWAARGHWPPVPDGMAGAGMDEPPAPDSPATFLNSPLLFLPASLLITYWVTLFAVIYFEKLSF